jgi:UPF0042 nucleotide-binding protein
MALARPKRLNALSRQTLQDLAQASRWFDEQRDVKVVVVSGQGTSFCAGFDLNDFMNPDPEWGVRESADLVIDSSSLNIHQLEKKIAEYFHEDNSVDLQVNILSFGYKYGIPVDADLVVDCRFIANPHWDLELRPMTGLEKPVRDAVLNSQNVQEFLSRYQSLFETMATGFIAEGRKYLTLAIGCTGGKHRSVAITQELQARLSANKLLTGKNIQTKALHRDLGREI